MDIMIRKMTARDKREVIDMMRVFYRSPAVSTDGSDEIFANDVDECVSDSPFLSGYVFEVEGTLAGYAMTAHSYSTEFGRPCVWIEDLYIKEEFRRLGIGTSFFAFIENEHRGSLLRLEVEHENVNALELYKKRGFTFLPYAEMMKGEN